MKSMGYSLKYDGAFKATSMRPGTSPAQLYKKLLIHVDNDTASSLTGEDFIR